VTVSFDPSRVRFHVVRDLKERSGLIGFCGGTGAVGSSKLAQDFWVVIVHPLILPSF
jgi:hypothetical protein